MTGSSPHARGLQGVRGQCAAGEGIIPARAGFTPRGSHPISAPADHPRTRGVYTGRDRVTSIVTGSSPHARGLPQRHTHGLRGRRIIPARAGFTCEQLVARFTARDHPRTRGVYGPGLVGQAEQGGSSPHARGLPPIRSPPREYLRDHPRTRGVYAATCDDGSWRCGSSPHARGLRFWGV